MYMYMYMCTAKEVVTLLSHPDSDFVLRATACNATHDITVAVMSVRLSNACIVTKLNDELRAF